MNNMIENSFFFPTSMMSMVKKEDLRESGLETILGKEEKVLSESEKDKLI